MMPELIQYLENIRYNSRLNPPDETGVMSELEAHIEDEVQELIESGLTKKEALKVCMGQMGGTGLIARQIYEAYSQGSWRQVLLASMPHLLFGLIFALNWWHYPGWLLLVLSLTLAVTAYGWWRGRPFWIFSWLGYTLLPVIAVGILLLYLPKEWSLLTLPIYFPLALWWLFRLIVQTSNRDWLFSSLMLLPVPIIAGWYLAVVPDGKITEAAMLRLDFFAPWIGLSFIALGMVIAVFIRLRQRSLRIGLLAASGMATVALVVYYTSDHLNVFTFFGLMLVVWGVLLIPSLLERFLRHSKRISLTPDKPLPSRSGQPSGR